MIHNNDYKLFVEYAIKHKMLSHANIEKYNAQQVINDYDKNKLTYVYFDLETTPMFLNQKLTDSSIIEIGALCINNGLEFSQLCNPGHKIINSHIHNITDDMVKYSSTTKECLTNFVHWLNTICNYGLIILIAHNGSVFDKHVLQKHLTMHNIDSNNTICIADTRYILGNYYKDLKSKSLENLYKHILNAEYIEKHRAIEDAKDLKQICDVTIEKSNISIYDFIIDKIYLLKYGVNYNTM